MEFLRPDLIYLFIITPILFGVYIIYLYWRYVTIKKYFKKDFLINKEFKNKYFHKMQFVIFMCAVVLIIMSILGPRIGKDKEVVKREGVDVVFALDVSKSMLAEDVKPNRLKKSIQILFESIRELKGDRVGVIVYAGESYPLVPITLDYRMVISLLKSVDTKIVSSQGTDLSSALSLSLNYFDDDERSKCLFILSDGEDHENSYEHIMKEISSKDIIINTICIGTDYPTPIPIKKVKNKVLEYKKNKDNKIVKSKINKDALKGIALNSKGNFFHSYSYSNQKTINFIKKSLDNLEKSISAEEIYVDYKEQFQWFAGFALFLIIFDFILI